ncbi:hypothetical protein G6F24_018863 [Rhizopus arrhizus]|nr:hypothetical protein G6F24_018863 [Rhizopus arrhizus]
MITSRSGDKHRQRAFEIGVQRYLGKPYQELDLMRNVYDLLGIARVRDWCWKTTRTAWSRSSCRMPVRR